jgi:hypothetical protein
VERWNGGTVERWNGGTVERWNGGTVERWNAVDHPPLIRGGPTCSKPVVATPVETIRMRIPGISADFSWIE